MEINKNISIICSFRSKQSLKTETPDRIKKLKSEIKTDSGKDTLIQLSDYLRLKEKVEKLPAANFAPLSTPEQAEEMLTSTKFQTSHHPNETLLAQTINNPRTIFYLLS